SRRAREVTWTSAIIDRVRRVRTLAFLLPPSQARALPFWPPRRGCSSALARKRRVYARLILTHASPLGSPVPDPMPNFLACTAFHNAAKTRSFSMDITDQQKSPSIAVATLEDVQHDLGALRNDVSRLSKEVSAYVSETGRKAVRDANEQLEDAVRERPLVAIAIAAGLGLLFGAIFWRR